MQKEGDMAEPGTSTKLCSVNSPSRISKIGEKDNDRRSVTGDTRTVTESANDQVDGMKSSGKTADTNSQRTSRPESRLNIQDMEEIEKYFLKEGDGYDDRLSLSRDQFCLALQTILKRGSLEEYGELYDKIDIPKEGNVDWDKFASHMLLELYEKDDRVKSTQVPQWKDLKHLPSPHKEVITRVSFLKNTSRYIAISKEGCVSMWGQNLKLQRSLKTGTDSCRNRDLWVTNFVPLQNINKIALAFTSKEIAFYDLSSKLEFNCQYKVQELPHTPICLDYWSNPQNTNEAIITWGDTGGGLNAIRFNSASIALFERPPAPAGEKQEPCLNVKLAHVKKGKYKNAEYVKHTAHKGEWVRQVQYSSNLECFISCATTWKNALVIGWMEKKANSKDMKTTLFQISQGVNAFDHHEKLNLIATAGVNHHVCLWNPYVVSKPNGVLRGHMASVVQVQFNKGRGQLISFSKDKVLRIWDVQLQVCMQRLAGMFPKGPEVTSMLFFDEIRNKLFITFNYQLTVIEMKPEIRDRIMSHEKPLVSALYNSMYNQVVSVCQGGTVIVWMVDTGQKVKQVTNTHGAAEVTALAQDVSQTRLYTGSTDGTVKVWDFNGHCYHTLHCSDGQPADVGHILALKRSILVIGWAKYVTVFRTQQLRDFHVQASDWKGGQEHSDDILAAAFSGPNTLATGSYDGEIVVWNNNSEHASKHLKHRSRKELQRRNVTFLAGGGGGGTREVTAVSEADSEHKSTAPRSEDATRTKDDQSRPQSRPCSRATSKMSLGSGDEGQEFGYNITCLIFLECRMDNSASGAATLVSCGGNGIVRFWNPAQSALMAEFIAHPQVGSIIMTVDKTNHYLVTGDADGFIKVWNIAEYCRESQPEGSVITTSPPMLAHWQPHQDSVNSIELCQRNDRHLILTASADASMALWDIYGNQIGIFGQEEHWKIEPYVPRLEEGMDDRELSAFLEERHTEAYDEVHDACESDDDGPVVQEETEAEVQGEIAEDSQWEPDDRAVTEPESYRFNTWHNTHLGRNYQETRVQKRERRQPMTISDLPYLHWERTGQPPAGPYAALETSQLTGVSLLRKPDFITNPHRYFAERTGSASGSGPSRLPHLAESLKTAFDEKTLFPRYVLEFEAKMKSDHLVLLREQQRKAGTGLLKGSGLTGPSPQGRSIASPAASKRGGPGGLRPYRVRPMGSKSASVKEAE